MESEAREQCIKSERSAGRLRDTKIDRQTDRQTERLRQTDRERKREKDTEATVELSEMKLVQQFVSIHRGPLGV